MASYGAIEVGNVGIRHTKRPRAMAIALVAAGCALAMAGVLIAHQSGQTSSLLSALVVPVAMEEPYLIMPRIDMPVLQMTRDGLMLYDAALEPLYKDESDPIEPYVWVDAHKDEYDPEAQNAFADLPMKREDIVDPDSEFEADKDMSKSCDKTNSCEEENNVWKDLPTEEDKTLAKRDKNPPDDPAWDAWSQNPTDI